jgi:hypothetical protein
MRQARITRAWDLDPDMICLKGAGVRVLVVYLFSRSSCVGAYIQKRPRARSRPVFSRPVPGLDVALELCGERLNSCWRPRMHCRMHMSPERRMAGHAPNHMHSMNRSNDGISAPRGRVGSHSRLTGPVIGFYNTSAGNRFESASCIALSTSAQSHGQHVSVSLEPLRNHTGSHSGWRGAVVRPAPIVEKGRDSMARVMTRMGSRWQRRTRARPRQRSQRGPKRGGVALARPGQLSQLMCLQHYADGSAAAGGAAGAAASAPS